MALEGRILPSRHPDSHRARCNAPVLLIHGLKDKLWKAKRSERLERRLKAAGKHVETFYMADEAHILSMLAVDRVIARLVAFLDKVFATLSP